MGRRTGELAFDVAWARPHAVPGVALGIGYSGPALIDEADAIRWGVPFWIGFESTITRAYAGYDAGIADATWHRNRLRAAAPWYDIDERGTWYCAADTPSTPAAFLPGIREYGRAWRDVFPGKVIGGYGNPEARQAAAEGTGEPFIPWGIGTWREGEDRFGNPPEFSTAAILQSGNNPGPAEGTDLDWLYVPVSAFGAWRGGPVGASTEESVRKGSDEMQAVLASSDGFWVKRGEWWVIGPGKTARRVGQGQQNDQIIRDWAFTSPGSLPGEVLDGFVGDAVVQHVRDTKLDAFLKTKES